VNKMRLIIIDGLDGSGKDTQAQLIKTKYEKKGERVCIRSHPESDNFFGKKAKKALLEKRKINKIKASIFYMMDVLRSIRKYHRKEKYDTIIMVRYLVGTAYLPKKLVKVGYRFFENFVPTSDYMFFLDAAPDVLAKRVEGRSNREIFETFEGFVNVRNKALSVVHDWIIIDASDPIEDVFSKIEGVLDTIDLKNN